MTTQRTSRGQLRSVGLVTVVVAVMTCATACGNTGARFKEGAVISDCGQQLGIGGVSYPVNFTPGGVVEPNGTVELVDSCKVGVQVAINQPDFKVVGAIHTKDGAYQSVALAYEGATGANGVMTVSRNGRRLGQMTLLTRYAPPPSWQPNFCDNLAHNCGSTP